MNDNGNGADAPVAVSPKRRRASLPLIIVAALFIIVPFLTWYGTWFGRNISDEEIATYLADEKNPRHIQHALSRIEERIERGDPTVKKFYPQIAALTKSPTAEIRKTAAWVMGQDNKSEEFHQALLILLKDNEPLVRRNAALQLVRFADASGRPELRAMLQPFEAKSPISGVVVSVLAQSSEISAGGLLVRIRDPANAVQEFRSPLDGSIGTVAVKEGETVGAGQTIVWLMPDRATINGALQALGYVGASDDLPLVETFSQGTASNDTDIKKQAALTAKAISSRRQSDK